MHLFKMAQPNIQLTSAPSKIVLGATLLIVGCSIYLLFRSKSLNLYQWCSTLGLSTVIDDARFCVQDWYIPNFIKFSLPDGLYVAAYILIMDYIWQDDENFIKHIVISSVPLFTIISEILQYFKLVKGTFDNIDLIFYTFPLVAYYCYKYNFNKFYKLKIQKL